MTPVVTSDIPRHSPLDARSVETANFKDCYRVTLNRSDMAMPAIFFGIFGHHPVWMKRLLIIRNRIAARCGLDVAADSAILRPTAKEHYAVGEGIGPWPIFHMGENELAVGRDNKHLDFRLSIMKQSSGQRTEATVATVCNVHNPYGKAYLWLIVPFHKWSVRQLLATAVRAGRI